jgi:hypothetical protein
MHHKGKVVSRTELIEHIYDQDFDRDSNTIEVFVTRIRKKLGADVITTIRGLGYSLDDPADQPARLRRRQAAAMRAGLVRAGRACRAGAGHSCASQAHRASLARRMMLIAAAWIFVLLLGGGIALERTLTTQVEANFDEQLEYILTAMIASAEIDPFGEVYFYRTLGDQRFLEPGSGLYWQISGGDYDPWPSRSLWDRTLAAWRGIEANGHFDSEPHFYNSGQFPGDRCALPSAR